MPGAIPRTRRRLNSEFASAFSLIEIMVVVAVMGLIMAMGIPSVVGALKKEGLRLAVGDVVEACTKARAEAIMKGVMAELHYQPKERRVSAAGFSAQLPENVAVEMWDVNLTEFKDADEARVRFYPNGMCDELTVVLRSDRGEWRKISLEITTGRSTVGEVR
jgi:prepilin-type N-terminal cleavage/methylation domain-containing protein